MRPSTRLVTMLAWIILCFPALADKSFVRDDLASDAVRLETTLVEQYGAQTKSRPADQLYKNGRDLAQRGDRKNALDMFGATIAAGRKDAAAWLDLARAASLAPASDDSRREQLLEWAATGAYEAYRLAGSSDMEAAALALLGDVSVRRELWRPALDAYRASLERSNNPKVRATYEPLREKYGFRITDYKVDSDSASPRVCFQFSEPVAKGKVDFSPYIAVSGVANAAITAEEQQVCVEGLKHGDRTAIVVRQGLPSSVGESLLKSADYEIYVRDRSPQVHFTGKNYVLPRVGQEGIPVVSVNTPKIDIDILRVGDRNLLPTVRSEEFLGQLGQYKIREIANNDGVKVWSGTLDVKPELNRDVTTAFPVLQAVDKLEAGVYVMLARPSGSSGSSALDDNEGPQRSTQWFVVSDLGLTAFSGTDGVHVLVRSLATADPLNDVELRLVARNNEILATGRTDSTGHLRFDPGLARGAGGLAPGLLLAMNAAGDYNFLDLVQTPFDLTDRGVKGRPAAKALDAFVYTERGVYRSGETVFVTALLRDVKGVARTGLPLVLVAKRPDGVEYKRTSIEDQGLGDLTAWIISIAPARSREK